MSDQNSVEFCFASGSNLNPNFDVLLCIDFDEILPCDLTKSCLNPTKFYGSTVFCWNSRGGGAVFRSCVSGVTWEFRGEQQTRGLLTLRGVLGDLGGGVPGLSTQG
jgi:hypothetical protein